MSLYLHDVPFDLFLKYYKNENKDFITSNYRYKPVTINVYTDKLYDSYYKYKYKYYEDSELKTKIVYFKIPIFLINNIADYTNYNSIFHTIESQESATVEYLSSSEILSSSDNSSNRMLYESKITNLFLSKLQNITNYKYFAVIGNKIYPFVYKDSNNTFKSALQISETSSDNDDVSQMTFTEESFPVPNNELYVEALTNERYYQITNSDGIEIGRVYEFYPYYSIKTSIENNKNLYYFTDIYTNSEVSFEDGKLPISPLMRYHLFMRKYKNSLNTWKNISAASLYFEDNTDNYRLILWLPASCTITTSIKNEITSNPSLNIFKNDILTNTKINQLTSKISITPPTSNQRSKRNALSSLSAPNMLSSVNIAENVLYKDYIKTNNESTSVNILFPFDPTEEVNKNYSEKKILFDSNYITDINKLDSNDLSFFRELINQEGNDILSKTISDDNDINKIKNLLKAYKISSNDIGNSLNSLLTDNFITNFLFPNNTFYFFSFDSNNIYVAVENYVVYSDSDRTFNKMQILSLSSFIVYIITCLLSDNIKKISGATSQELNNGNECIFSESTSVSSNNLNEYILQTVINKIQISINKSISTGDPTYNLTQLLNSNYNVSEIKKIFKSQYLYENNLLNLNELVSGTKYSDELRGDFKKVVKSFFTSNNYIYPISSISKISEMYMYINSLYENIPILLNTSKIENNGINYYSYKYNKNKYGFPSIDELNLCFDYSINDLNSNSHSSILINSFDIESSSLAAESQVLSKNVFDRLFNYSKFSINQQEIDNLVNLDKLKNIKLNTVSSEKIYEKADAQTATLYYENNNDLNILIDQFISLYSNYLYDESINSDFYVNDYRRHFIDKINYKYNTMIPNNFDSNYNIRYVFTTDENINKNILLTAMKIKKQEGI